MIAETYMHILILEPPQAVDPRLLLSLTERGHTLHEYGSDVEKKSIHWLVVRSGVSVDEGLLSEYVSLTHVFRVWVWLDNIDCDLCQKKNIQVINTPWANAQSVADMAIWWILSLLRHTHHITNMLHRHSERFDWRGRELSHLHCVIAWYWHVWMLIEQRLRWFGVTQITVVDPRHHHDDEIETVESIHEAAPFADVLFLCVPLMKDTYHMVNETFLGQAKKNIQIINISRWGIIDEKALVTFLETNKQAWAYLDVREKEPELTENVKRLIELPNCLMTPHIAWLTDHARERMHEFVL